jgi:hypothetical protein
LLSLSVLAKAPLLSQLLLPSGLVYALPLLSPSE